MTLDRWVALAILSICVAYGYAAFFSMDGQLPPILRRNPIWPSTFPKALAVGAVVCALAILIGPGRRSGVSASSQGRGGVSPPSDSRNAQAQAQTQAQSAIGSGAAGLGDDQGDERIDPSPAPGSSGIVSLFRQYKTGQALILLGLMVAYALLLKPLGFLASTFAFLAIGGWLLGERRLALLAGVAALAAGGVWYLVDSVLGIYLGPLPQALSSRGA